jgi:structural maintenance of chromosomes protein 5
VTRRMRNINRRCPSSIRVCPRDLHSMMTLNRVFLSSVDQTFNAIKVTSKQALDDSRQILNDATPELRAEYQAIEDVRARYEKDLATAEKDGLSPPSSEDVDLRSLEELRAELETQKANLDLNLATNPGVVEQYEKRKRDVRVYLRALCHVML